MQIYNITHVYGQRVFMESINNVHVTMPQGGFDPPFEQSDAVFTEWKTDALAN